MQRIYLIFVIKRSKWHSNEFARGSYSFLSTKNTPEDVENLAEPLVRQIQLMEVKNKLQFVVTN